MMLILDLFAGYVFYQVVKFIALNLYLPAIKEAVGLIFRNNQNATR